MTRAELERQARLERDVADLRSRIRNIPATFTPAPSTTIYTVKLYDGNTLSSGQQGIKKTSGTLNESFASSEATMLAAAYGTTLPNGVGRGYLYADGAQVFSGSSPLLVLVGLDSRSAIFFCMAEGEEPKVSATRIKIGTYSGSNVYGYRPEFR